jgi:hypothetical protein
MVLTYKNVGFLDFATDEMVEAASKFDLEKCVELAMEKFMYAPEAAYRARLRPPEPEGNHPP